MSDAPRVVARTAAEIDLAALLALYRLLEEEMTALHPMWPVADGLDEPVEHSLLEALSDADAELVIGTIDEVPFGFALGRVEPTLGQGDGAEIGAIRLVFTELDAREVGVGEAMREHLVQWFRSRGISWFDAHVLPGHRLAKNFFEAGGFSARSIVMHHDDGER